MSNPFKVGDWVVITHPDPQQELYILGQVVKCGLYRGECDGICIANHVITPDPHQLDTHRPGEWPLYGVVRIEHFAGEVPDGDAV